jgi:predicted nucleic acid-binding protein
MSRVIVLDTSPLGMLANPFRATPGTDILRWTHDQVQAGHRLVVPAVADYELRRELIRNRSSRSLLLLDRFIQAEPGRYLPLTDEALQLAATLWAQARNRGTPTADPKELDCDVLIAAQALTLGVPVGDLVIATSNVGHLSQFAPAALWNTLAP